VRRFSRRQDVWFHVHLPFVQAVSAPQGEVDEIGLVGQRARAKRGAGATATRGTTERFRRVGWVGAIRSISTNLARLQERDRVVARAEWRRSVLKTTRQMSKDAAGVDFIQFLAIRGGGRAGQIPESKVEKPYPASDCWPNPPRRIRRRRRLLRSLGSFGGARLDPREGTPAMRPLPTV